MVSYNQQNSTNPWIGWAFFRTQPNRGFGQLQPTELLQPIERLGCTVFNKTSSCCNSLHAIIANFQMLEIAVLQLAKESIQECCTSRQIALSGNIAIQERI
jgi:hypothetical protein